MGFLTNYENGCISFQGHIYRLDLSYDTVLNVQRMYREKLLNDADLLTESLKILGVQERAVLQIDWKDRGALFEKICNEKISTRSRPSIGQQKKLFDFEEDGEYIYASFMQDYGMDLIEQQGKLPWNRFVALFQGLSDKAKIKEVMRIRNQEIPATTKTNHQEIKTLMELKAYYALSQSDFEENGKEGLDRLFTTLEGMAK